MLAWRWRGSGLLGLLFRCAAAVIGLFWSNAFSMPPGIDLTAPPTKEWTRENHRGCPLRPRASLTVPFHRQPQPCALSRAFRESAATRLWPRKPSRLEYLVRIFVGAGLPGCKRVSSREKSDRREGRMTGVAAATRVAAPPSRLEEQSKDPFVRVRRVARSVQSPRRLRPAGGKCHQPSLRVA